jgi:hypothetical protein
MDRSHWSPANKDIQRTHNDIVHSTLDHRSHWLVELHIEANQHSKRDTKVGSKVATTHKQHQQQYQNDDEVDGIAIPWLLSWRCIEHWLHVQVLFVVPAHQLQQRMVLVCWQHYVRFDTQ